MAWMTAPSLNLVSTSFLTAGEAAPEVDPLAGVGGTACVCLALEPFLGCVTNRRTAYVWFKPNADWSATGLEKGEWGIVRTHFSPNPP